MGLFQTSVLKKYIKLQDKKAVEKAYQKYSDYFHNSERQENIRVSKEEQFQEGFLRELFVKVLDYTLNPEPQFNLTTELKNEKGAKKADGAILASGHDHLTRKALAIIELKSTKTKDLESIRQQAFDYKANHSECIYVITSNFEKLRFYINNAVDFEEFNLFTLNKEQFELLYLCLYKENILNNVPLKIKTDSVVAEESITKKFYSDYSQFKRELFRDLVKQNIKNEIFRTELQNEDADRASKNIKLALFKKSQKLIDRFLFIFFAEDKGLLPPNSTLQIINKWKADCDFGDERPLYDLFKQYFKFLDIGRKSTQSRAEIFAYNGGLFKPDPILDGLILDSQTLCKHTKILSDYDFESQVGVNILGHIFENSLNEIESVNAEIEGKAFDKQKTKRKKDGVFYTPKYITKYIVDNTVGKLCQEKKQELEIKDEEYQKSRKGRKTDTLKKLKTKLDNYRNWLLTITILDPACGSGAFLNQALDFLIKEHTYIDELETSLLGGGMVMKNIENTILENNIFGVDINEESVEIAKLSLWLRTAQPRRKLNTLNNNIKCGNSLIDDPEIAGDKAFNWQDEFPHIFSEKKKNIWHITTATHNSRYSQRMFDNNVKTGDSIWLDDKDEIVITKTIAEIVKKDNLNVIEYNICGDHLHILLVCEKNELPKIVGKLKSMSSRAANIAKGYTTKKSESDTTKGHAPLSLPNEKPERGETQTKLWTQKYGKSEINDEEYLNNAIKYIRNNRIKHELPRSKEIEKIKNEFLCSKKQALRTEYNGGFDVVIGNPPYVQLQKMKKISAQIKELNYKTYESTGDLYCLFYELGNELLKQKGFLGYITSNKWMRANYGKSLRKYFYENTNPYTLIDLGAGVFEGAVVDSNIILLKKGKTIDFQINSIDLSNQSNIQDFSIFYNQFVQISPNNDEVWTISSETEQNLKAKIETLGTHLKEWNIELKYGIKTGLNDAFIITKEQKNNLILKDPKSEELIKPVLRGRDVSRYKIDYQDLYLINVHNGYSNIERINIDNYPAIKEHFEEFEPQLSKRYDKGNTPYNLRNCAYVEAFEKEKIIWKEMSAEPPFVLDNNGFYTNDTITFIVGENLKYLLAQLNSKLFFYIFSNYYSGGGLGSKGIRFKKDFLSNVPVKQPTDNIEVDFINIVDVVLKSKNDLQKSTNTFLKYLSSQFSLNNISQKLQNWHELEFADFIKELNKAIKKANKEVATATTSEHIHLTKKDEMEWMELFEEKKAEAQTLKTEIEKTDKEIDKMVYEIYGLTEDEIKIVEGIT